MPSIHPDNRWLPPSPHREKLLETIRCGRAHVEEQGHGKPPLLVYEDGGAMELPRYRWVDGKAVAAEGSDPAAQTTQFLDVCGTIDELKRLLREEPAATMQELERLFLLLDDALQMIGRMFARLRQYHEFKEKVLEQIQRMDALTGPDHSQALENAAALRELLPSLQSTVREGEEASQPGSASGGGCGVDLETLFYHAEQVRDVAQKLEENLYPLRDACIEIFRLYDEVRGAREWKPKIE